MGKILFTCEKPDAAKHIADALNVTTKQKGYYENDKYIITWAYGHLIEWKKPEEINSKYKVWSLDNLPYHFDITKDLKVKDDVKSQYSIICKLINRADVDFIVNAGDADREGLLIQEEIYRFAQNKKKVKILWAESTTEGEIIKCLNNLKDRNDFIGLLESAKARSTIDYMMGYTYTCAIAKTVANDNRISYGRCQTPLLKLLSDRENEISNFVSKNYYVVKSKFDKGYEGIYVDGKGEVIKFDSDIEAKNIINDTPKTGNILDIKEENKKESAPNLYSLLELQKDMGGRYQFSPDKTLKIAQKLYEEKLTSYPRTDSEYINEEVYNEINDRIKSAISYLNIDREKLNVEQLKKMVKPNKVTGHHAILPTEKIADSNKLSKLTEDEKIVYSEICKRFVAVMLPDYEYVSTVILTALSDKNFLTKGRTPVKLGYKELYKNSAREQSEDENNDEQILPELYKNDKVEAILNIDAKKTSGPKRYTGKTIISLMEKYNIGRPATMPEIIESLIKREFIEFNKNKYFVTKKGIDFINIIPEELKDPYITQRIEEKLSKIADNEYSYNQLVEDVLNEQISKIELLKEMAKTTTMKNPLLDRTTDYKCPICGKNFENQKYSYICSCGFKINKEILGKKLSESNINDICSKGKTSTIKGFKKKDGNTFDAILAVDKEKKQLTFKFPDTKKKFKK